VGMVMSSEACQNQKDGVFRRDIDSRLRSRWSIASVALVRCYMARVTFCAHKVIAWQWPGDCGFLTIWFRGSE